MVNDRNIEEQPQRSAEAFAERSEKMQFTALLEYVTAGTMCIPARQYGHQIQALFFSTRATD
jgi:hypothetical protein